MNETLVANWNSAVKPEDTVFHVGDFCFHSLASYWESLLNGKVIHVKGNHDKLSNGVDTPLEIALMNLGHYQVLVQHRPPTMELEIPEIADFVLCGHVHEKWKHRWLGNKMLINVGTDVWNFRPVSIPEIITYFEQHKNEPVTIRIPISN
jgi:calcineurin-like phosphoesterase family protein